MKKITNNDELEVGKEYWCKFKTSKSMPQLFKVGEQGGWKYIGSRIWATNENNQALEKFDIIGPVEYPNFDDFKTQAEIDEDFRVIKLGVDGRN